METSQLLELMPMHFPRYGFRKEDEVLATDKFRNYMNLYGKTYMPVLKPMDFG
jgi:hypothetical protein